MKMVFLAYLHGYGGAERQIILLANAMSEKGHDVTLISICDGNMCYALGRGVKYRHLPDRRKNVLRIITRYIDIKKQLEELRPDVTVSFWFQSAYLTAAMPKSITGKVVYSERGDPGDREYGGLMGLIRKLALPRIDAFAFQSKAAQGYFNKSVRRRSAVIPNPVFVGTEDFTKVCRRRKAIVTVGRLHPQKNQRLLINAFALIADRFPEYTLEIYGSGELENALKRQISSLGLTDRAFLMGTSDRVHELMRGAELFVLSSDYEGLPNTLMEAMAMRLPCVSTDCRPGGARELIDDGRDGIIVPVNDCQKLAAAVAELLDDGRRREEFGVIAAAKMKRFAPSRIYNKWNAFFIKTARRSD